MAVWAAAILYGLFIGVLGIGPDGPGVPFHWRMLGVSVLLLGGLYFVPNKKLMKSPCLTYGYLGLNLLPTIALGIAAAITITGSGMDSFVRDGGPETISAFLPLSLLAPLSLIFSMLGARGEAGGPEPQD
jgi:hypothetical protein